VAYSLRQGARRDQGASEVAAAVGDHPPASERRATDRGGVLPGEAERAGSDVAVVAAVGDGDAMTMAQSVVAN
jgi:hypothetical protein